MLGDKGIANSWVASDKSIRLSAILSTGEANADSKSPWTIAFNEHFSVKKVPVTAAVIDQC